MVSFFSGFLVLIYTINVPVCFTDMFVPSQSEYHLQSDEQRSETKSREVLIDTIVQLLNEAASQRKSENISGEASNIEWQRTGDVEMIQVEGAYNNQPIPYDPVRDTQTYIESVGSSTHDVPLDPFSRSSERANQVNRNRMNYEASFITNSNPLMKRYGPQSDHQGLEHSVSWGQLQEEHFPIHNTGPRLLKYNRVDPSRSMFHNTFSPDRLINAQTGFRHFPLLDQNNYFSRQTQGYFPRSINLAYGAHANGRYAPAIRNFGHFNPPVDFWNHGFGNNFFGFQRREKVEPVRPPLFSISNLRIAKRRGFQ